MWISDDRTGRLRLGTRVSEGRRKYFIGLVKRYEMDGTDAMGFGVTGRYSC